MKVKIGDKFSHEEAMALAIEVARRGLGFVSPNPPVGCVILDRESRFVSAGAHLKFGEAHAEVNAINCIKNLSVLEGATLYVTLEPCAHIGKTPSCAQTISLLPIKKVYYGYLDPNPLVEGKGLEILTNAGIEVEPLFQFAESIEKLTEQFFFHIKNKRPFVSLKAGVSLDGKIALRSGESQWITCEEARSHARSLRAHYDATFIGAGTFINDNPNLDFKGSEFEGKKKNKVILFDPKAKGAEFFTSSNLRKIHEEENIIIITQPNFVERWSKKSVQVLEWEDNVKSWNLILEKLYAKGIASIFVEGGSYAFGQFLQYQLAQKLYIYQAPKILGEGKGWSDAFKIKSLQKALELKKTTVCSVGSDQLLIGYFI